MVLSGVDVLCWLYAVADTTPEDVAHKGGGSGGGPPVCCAWLVGCVVRQECKVILYCICHNLTVLDVVISITAVEG